MNEDLKDILTDILDILERINFYNNFDESLHCDIRDIIIPKVYNLECNCNSNKCNIVELFTSSINYMLKLLDDNKIDEVKEIMRGFLIEE